MDLPTAATLTAAASAVDGPLARVMAAGAERDGALLAAKDARTGRYLWVNDAMARWIGRAPSDIVGRTDAELLDGPMLPALRLADQAAVAAAQAVCSEHQLLWQGRRWAFSVVRLSAPDAHGRPCITSVWTDVAAQRQQAARLHAVMQQLELEQRAHRQLRQDVEQQNQALSHGPVRLYDRAHFDDQFRREVDLSTREHREFALVAVTLDDASAHAGEARAAVLDVLDRLLRRNTRAMDAPCRTGDTQFAVLLSGVGLSTAHGRMECLRRECASQIVVVDGRELRFSVSMGVASFPHTAHQPDDLLRAAEAALSDAVRRGGNCIALATIRFDAAAAA